MFRYTKVIFVQVLQLEDVGVNLFLKSKPKSRDVSRQIDLVSKRRAGVPNRSITRSCLNVTPFVYARPRLRWSARIKCW